MNRISIKAQDLLKQSDPRLIDVLRGMKQTAYSINCRVADFEFLRRILIPEQISLEELKIPELAQADPPADMIFLGWEEVQLEETQHFSTKEVVGIMLTKIREALSFRDVPVFVLAGRTFEKEAQVMLKLGANRVLSAPLDRQEAIGAIRSELSFAGTRSTIDARVVNPFAEGAMKVFESMAKTSAEREQVLLKKDYRLLGDISAMIMITGERAAGSVALTFESGLAWTLVGRMLGAAPSKLKPEDVYDGIGELTNMISGFAETALAANGESVETVFLCGALLGLQLETARVPGPGKVSRVHEYFERAVELDPLFSDGAPLRALGTLLVKAPSWPAGPGDVERGIELLTRAVLEHRDDPANHYYFGEALLADGRRQEAERSFLYAAHLCRDSAVPCTAICAKYARAAREQVRKLRS